MAIIWDKVTDTLFKMTNIKELFCQYLRENGFYLGQSDRYFGKVVDIWAKNRKHSFLGKSNPRHPDIRYFTWLINHLKYSTFQ